MAAYKLTDDVLAAMWANLAGAYSVKHEWVALESTMTAPRQCTIRDEDTGVRCTRPGAFVRNGKQCCSHHAPRLSAQYARDYALAATRYRTLAAQCTSAASEREALESSKRRDDARATVTSARPSL